MASMNIFMACKLYSRFHGLYMYVRHSTKMFNALMTRPQTLFALTSTSLVKSFALYAAGFGISDIKYIIAGSFWTLLIKSICLSFAVASGLSVGKKGRVRYRCYSQSCAGERPNGGPKANSTSTPEAPSVCMP